MHACPRIFMHARKCSNQPLEAGIVQHTSLLLQVCLHEPSMHVAKALSESWPGVEFSRCLFIHVSQS